MLRRPLGGPATQNTTYNYIANILAITPPRTSTVATMQLPSIQAANDSNGPLLSIPVELMTEILSALPSFFDVLALAATCRQLRHIWTTNVTSIYSQVASRSVPCERYARRFLADHGGLATSFSTPSARDALCILRNSCVVEKAILKFEKDIVCRIQSTF